MLPRDYVGQNCSIARTLEVLGDRWTLLIVRSALFGGRRRFDELLERLGMARNVLADRLARLTDEGILERHLYQEHPPRYEYGITGKGRELLPVLMAMVEWGDRHYAPAGPPREILHEGCGGAVALELHCSRCGEPVDGANVTTRPGPGAGVGASR